MGTYAGQFVMEGFLNIHWAKWKRVLLTRSIAIVPTIAVALLATDNLDDMNNWLNVLQSIQLPFALLPVLHFTNSDRIMGEFRNTRATRVIVWLLVILVLSINFYLVFLFVGEDQQWYIYLITAFVVLLYALYLGYLAMGTKVYLRIKLLVLVKLNGDITDVSNELIRRQTLKYSE
ncbi:hypothetical protein ScPMuIL_012755 [Solemya velum]